MQKCPQTVANEKLKHPFGGLIGEDLTVANMHNPVSIFSNIRLMRH
jgi:hypothetical protein